MTKTITISLAINDDAGNWDYEVRRVDFGDIIDANPYYGREAQAEIKDDILYIGYVSVKVLRHINWYGSMAFEGILVSVEDAQRIAEYLRERGYMPEMGDAQVWRMWENDLPIVFAEKESGK